LASHRRRAARLAIEVSRRGGAPIVRSGLWGYLVGFTASLLVTLAVRLAARMLEIVEKHGIRRYDRSWNLLDGSARQLLTAHLFPQQVLSHQSLVLMNDSVASFVGTSTV
jgi:hypothetical protein